MSLKPDWRGVAVGAVGVLGVLGAAALLVVVTGSYNVAADDRHATPVEWALTTTMNNSIRSRADGIEVPNLTRAMVVAGAVEYKAMCQHCHGGVGAGRADWSHGMRPKPPPLAEEADQWKPKEIFWIVRHGIKMTGMPSFGGSHNDRKLWNIVAFVSEMPTMSAREYQAFSTEHYPH